MPRIEIHRGARNFDEAVTATAGLAMVDFWAEWCDPCRAIAPVLDTMVDASQGGLTLMKVNVDENPDLALRYGIRSIPTILFARDGAVIDRVVGAVPESMLHAMVRARLNEGVAP